MTKDEQLKQLNSLYLMMLAHPSNEEGNEFNDRLNGLGDVIESFKKESVFLGHVWKTCKMQAFKQKHRL